MSVQYLKYNHIKYDLKTLYGQRDIRWMLNETQTSFRHISRKKKINVFKDVTLSTNHLSNNTMVHQIIINNVLMSLK